MTEHTLVRSRDAGVEWSCAVPDGFTATEGLVPALAYPWDICGVSDWGPPPTDPRVVGDIGERGNFPRIALQPETAAMVWLVMGDVKKDRAVLSGGSYGTAYIAPQGVEPAGGTTTDVAPLGHPDEFQSPWPNVDMWKRLVRLTDRDGRKHEDALYLHLFVFVGRRRTDRSAIQEIVTSLRYRYSE